MAVTIGDQQGRPTHQIANLGSQLAIGRPTAANHLVSEDSGRYISVRRPGGSSVEYLNHSHVCHSRPLLGGKPYPYCGSSGFGEKVIDAGEQRANRPDETCQV